jgi:hypothetical protein
MTDHAVHVRPGAEGMKEPINRNLIWIPALATSFRGLDAKPILYSDSASQ